MSRPSPLLGVVVCAALALAAGCHPQQPFYFFEDGDLSHYLGVATEIEYPDAEVASLAEAEGAARPFSLQNSEPREVWELSLEEAIRLALVNSKVMRTLGGRTVQMPETLLQAPQSVPTVYGPAIAEADPLRGPEAALSAFDAQFSGSLFWEKGDRPRNVPPIPGLPPDVFPTVFQQDLGTFQAQLQKTAATGGTWTLRHNVIYDWSVGARRYPSDWNVNLEAEFRQPLLQGAGALFNRIAGPGATPGSYNGVMIARINTDVALAQFEGGVRNLVSDVESAYWELYFAYRHLDAMVTGRDFALGSWRKIHLEYEAGTKPVYDEAQARDEYLSFRSLMEQALNTLYAAESNLRYMMGLAATDGRLIRPADEPVTGRVKFDWSEILGEGLVRSVELRQQKWMVKQQELALIASKNHLLPRLDAVGRYRWLGLGDDLIELNGGSGDPTVIGSNAYQSMTSGDFQEWHFGLEMAIPIGFRRELAGVRHAQLSLARERARLQEQELELSHQLAAAIRQLEADHVLCQTNFNRRIAAMTQVEVMQISYEVGKVSLDRVLEARRRLAQAENDYYRSLVDYNKSIAQVHFRKGSLLEYNGVYLAEGPWPGKAYFDARRRARARDAGLFVDYGYTRPKVISRGAYRQHLGDGGELVEETVEAVPEAIPTPAPRAMDVPPEPPVPDPEDGARRRDATDSSGGVPWGAAGGGRTAGSQASGTGSRESSALAALHLGSPTGQSAGRQSGGGHWLAVRAVSANVPIESGGAESARESSRKAAGLKWRDIEDGDTRDEALANSPVAEADRTASGWKGIQR